MGTRKVKIDKCPMCASNSEVVMEQYEKGAGKHKIVVPNIKARKCKNDKCGHKWVPGEEQARIDAAMANFLN